MVQVGEREAGDSGERAVGPGDRVEDGDDLGVERVRVVAEGGQGRRPGGWQLTLVGGDLEQYARGDHSGNQPERLDQPTTRTVERVVRKGGDQRVAHRPRGAGGERLQRGLSKRAGEATVEDHLDQSRQRRGDQ